jgi:hypothetical protein
MIGFEDTTIKKIAHHKVSSEERKSIISDTLFDYSNEEEENVLKKLLLKPFTTHVNTFEFSHEVDLSYNVLFNLAKNIHSEEDFISNSKDIAQLLVSVSKHPNIKDGDLFIAKFEDLKLGNQYLDGVGIYKFEEKESFLETSVESNTLKRSNRALLKGDLPFSKHVKIVINEYITKLKKSKTGNRMSTLNKVCYSIGGLISYYELSQTDEECISEIRRLFHLNYLFYLYKFIISLNI